MLILLTGKGNTGGNNKRPHKTKGILLVMMAEQTTQRRQYFRLPYPDTSQPPFKLDNGKDNYRVLEIAENSLLLELSSEQSLSVNTPLAGEIIFHDMSSEYLSGTVFRLDDRGAVILLKRGISFRQVIREQLYIKSHFPRFFRHR